MPLFLFRHGETAHNVADKFQGHSDSNLTQLGQKQARENGRFLSRLIQQNRKIESIKIVSSPLGRTVATAHLIQQALATDTGEIQTDPRLIEMGYGHWEGLPRDDVRRQFPQQWADRSAHPDTYEIAGGGESYQILLARVSDWMVETRHIWDVRQTVWVVISHGGTGRAIRGRYLELDMGEMLTLDRPQDSFFELADGQVHRHTPDTAA